MDQYRNCVYPRAGVKPVFLFRIPALTCTSSENTKAMRNSSWLILWADVMLTSFTDYCLITLDITMTSDMNLGHKLLKAFKIHADNPRGNSCLKTHFKWSLDPDLRPSRYAWREVSPSPCMTTLLLANMWTAWIYQHIILLFFIQSTSLNLPLQAFSVC